MTTEERLATLERELVGLRAELAQRIETREIRVLDSNGMARAVLDVHGDVPGFILLDEAGKIRARLGVNKNGPELVLKDETGKGRVGLTMFNKDMPGLILYDKNGKPFWKAP